MFEGEANIQKRNRGFSGAMLKFRTLSRCKGDFMGKFKTFYVVG